VLRLNFSHWLPDELDLFPPENQLFDTDISPLAPSTFFHNASAAIRSAPRDGVRIHIKCCRSP
jgi:hypothetical protein